MCLLGHLNEICLGSNLSAALKADAIPLLPGAQVWAAEGHDKGASGRKRARYGHHITLNNVSDTMKSLRSDPQASGGLLVFVSRVDAKFT